MNHAEKRKEKKSTLMPIHLPHLKISEVGIRFQSLVSLV